MKVTVDFESGADGGAGVRRGGETTGTASPASAMDPVAEARAADALRSKLRKILIVLTVICLLLAAAGFAFTRWMMTLPPGTLKGH